MLPKIVIKTGFIPGTALFCFWMHRSVLFLDAWRYAWWVGGGKKLGYKGTNNLFKVVVLSKA